MRAAELGGPRRARKEVRRGVEKTSGERRELRAVRICFGSKNEKIRDVARVRVLARKGQSKEENEADLNDSKDVALPSQPAHSLQTSIHNLLRVLLQRQTFHILQDCILELEGEVLPQAIEQREMSLERRVEL